MAKRPTNRPRRDALERGRRDAPAALPTPATRSLLSRPPAWAVAVVLAATLGTIYGPSLSVPFIFDDAIAIEENESITSLWPLVGVGKPGPLNASLQRPTTARPLSNLSFALNYHFGGLDPTGYHAVNLLIHFGAAMLLWAITRRTLLLPHFEGRFDGLAEWLAFGVAALWSLHPLQTEAVIYATQRTELLMAFFYLATLYCSLRYWAAGHSKRWLVFATLACLGGMASKEVMVSAPVMVLLFERVFVTGSLARAWRRSWPLYVGLASTWVLLLALNISAPHQNSAGFHVGVPAYVWWFTQSKVMFLYLRLIVWPAPLLIHYQFPYLTTFTQAWMYVIPLLIAGMATLVLLWRNKAVGFLGAWFCAILSPTFVIPIITELAAERRLYLALAGPVALFVVGGYRLIGVIGGKLGRGSEESSSGARPRLVAFGVPIFLLAVVYCLTSTRRLAAYDDDMNLWLEVLQWQPNDSMAHQRLGVHFEKIGQDDGAMEQYRETLRLNPDAAQAHYRMGLILNKRQAYEEAITHLAEADRLLGNNATFRNDLGFARYVAGHNDEAIATFQAALQIDPNYWTAYQNLGTALQKAGRNDEAVKSFEEALRLNPNAFGTYNDLANIYVRTQRLPEAIAVLERGQEQARSQGDDETVAKFSAILEAARKR